MFIVYYRESLMFFGKHYAHIFGIITFPFLNPYYFSSKSKRRLELIKCGGAVQDVMIALDRRLLTEGQMVAWLQARRVNLALV